MAVAEKELIHPANSDFGQKSRPAVDEPQAKKSRLRRKAGAVLLAVGASAAGGGIVWKLGESTSYWWNELKIESSSRTTGEKAHGREKREETHQKNVDIAHTTAAAGAIPLGAGSVLWYPEIRRAVVRKLNEINDNTNLTS
jgi:hypothetical protein